MVSIMFANTFNVLVAAPGSNFAAASPSSPANFLSAGALLRQTLVSSQTKVKKKRQRKTHAQKQKINKTCVPTTSII